MDCQVIKQESISPWESLGPVLAFRDEDQKFWWYALAPVLGRMMTRAGYNTARQYVCLCWFNSFILPFLGPRPRPDRSDERPWKPSVTPTGAPFQPSWNLRGDQKSTIRFTVEPSTDKAGYREDVFNQLAALEMMRQLEPTLPGLESAWFWHCAEALYAPNPLINLMLLHKDRPRNKKPPTCFMAFDLNDDAIEAKAYFFPQISAWSMGVTSGKLVIETVRGLNSDIVDMNPGLAIFEDYLNSGGAVSHDDIEMLAVDLVDPSRARAKIYVHSFNNSYNQIEEIYTMGGRIKDPAVMDSLAALKRLWQLLFNMPEHDFEDIKLDNIQHFRSCFVTGFEFKSGSAVPTTKVYFPMWHYAKNDSDLSVALSSFFAEQGWTDTAKNYKKDVEEMFMEPEMDTTPGTHQYLSFAANANTGLYATIYYAPTIPHLTARHVPVPAGDGDPLKSVGPPGRAAPFGLRVLQAAWPLLKWIVPNAVKPVF